MTLEKAYYIYLKGYSKGCGFKLKDWFEAKSIVQRKSEDVKRIKNNVTISIK